MTSFTEPERELEAKLSLG